MTKKFTVFGQTPEKFFLLILEYLLYVLLKILLIFYYVPMVLIGMLRKKIVCAPLSQPPEVTLVSATELARRIAYREVKCRFVIEAFIYRMKEVNPIVNAIMEERFEEALKDADIVDERLQTMDKSSAEWLEEFPLLGVPLTVKESIAVEGMSNTAGYFQAATRRAAADAEVVTLCKKAGVIILAVTSTPELCLNWEAYNTFIGTTRNPYNTQKTCGGSSGGEAALLGAGASVIGLGSDLAGSLRLPAHFCGVFAHKPTAGVVSIEGHFPAGRVAEQWEANFNLGPMCRYASDLLPMMRILTKDEFQSRLNLSQKIDLMKINIYFLKDFGSLVCSKLNPEISTRLDVLLDQLKKKHKLKVKPLREDFFKNSSLLAIHSFLQIGGADYEAPKNWLSGLFKAFFQCSNVAFNTYSIEALNLYASILPDSIYTECSSQLDKQRNELEKLIGDNGVLLMPVFYRTAGYHYTTVPKIFDTFNGAIVNALGMPATACPIGLHTNGLPFGIQVISKRFNDRLSIALAEEVEKICGGWKIPQEV